MGHTEAQTIENESSPVVNADHIFGGNLNNLDILLICTIKNWSF